MAIVGSVIGLVIAYPLIIFAKLEGWFPPERFGWMHVATAPAACYGLFCFMLWCGVKHEALNAKKRLASRNAPVE